MTTMPLKHFSLGALKQAVNSVVVQGDVILSKRFLRSEGSGRAARCVALFATP